MYPRSFPLERYGAMVRCSPVSNATRPACLYMATPSLEPNFIDQAAPIPMYPDVALKLTGDITHLITFTSLSLLYLSCLKDQLGLNSDENNSYIVKTTHKSFFQNICIH